MRQASNLRCLMNIFAATALLSVVSLANAAEGDRTSVFEPFEVSNHDIPKLKYKFSRSRATLDDPVVITAVGRRLTDADRARRVDLQKVWLNENVPAELKFSSRSLVTHCGQSLRMKFSACDEYVFIDADGRALSYHIFIGNWP